MNEKNRFWIAAGLILAVTIVLGWNVENLVAAGRGGGGGGGGTWRWRRWRWRECFDGTHQYAGGSTVGICLAAQCFQA